MDKSDQVNHTHRLSFLGDTKKAGKVAAVVGIVLFAGMVGASASGGIFSFKVVPMISGLLIGASVAGAVVGGFLVLDHRRRCAEEVEAQKEAESPFSKEDLQYGAMNGAMAILRMRGNDDSTPSPLAVEGVFQRTDQDEAAIKKSQKELCEGTFVPGTVTIHTLAIAFIRIHKELELLGGNGMGLSIDPLVEAIESGDGAQAVEKVKEVLLGHLDLGEIGWLSGFIAIASELVEAQATLPDGQGMDLDGVARMVASNLRNTADEAEAQKFQKIVRFMIENHQPIFANPIDEE